LEEIDNLLIGGYGPTACRTELQVRYKKDDSMQGMIPPAKQLKNRKQYLRRSGICTSMCGMLASWFALQTSLS